MIALIENNYKSLSLFLVITAHNLVHICDVARASIDLNFQWEELGIYTMVMRIVSADIAPGNR